MKIVDYFKNFLKYEEFLFAIKILLRKKEINFK